MVEARFFSAEAAFDLLGATGVREIRSLGIDGGRAYSPAFKDLEGTTMLANTKPTFDIQFEELERIVAKHSGSTTLPWWSRPGLSRFASSLGATTASSSPQRFSSTRFASTRHARSSSR